MIFFLYYQLRMNTIFNEPFSMVDEDEELKKSEGEYHL